MPETEVVFHATFTSSETFNASFTSDATFAAGFGEVIKIADVPVFGGPYEATPSNVAQIIPTSQMLMTENFTVNPIPSNYGLITWDGSVLTVS